MLTEKPPTKVLIIAVPGMIRDSLCSLLSSLSDVRIGGVLSFADLSPQILDDCFPKIILMDCTGKAQQLESIREIKSGYPNHYCLVIVENSHKAWLAYHYGANDVLMRGCTGYEFKAAFQNNIKKIRANTRLTISQNTDVVQVPDENR
jgi:DNA-binding NarL/FixJ family response regulator